MLGLDDKDIELIDRFFREYHAEKLREKLKENINIPNNAEWSGVVPARSHTPKT